MRNKTPRTDLLIALFIGGLLLFNYPVLSLFSTDGNVFGLPSLYVYLFSAWGSFILCLRLILGRRGGSETSMLPQWLLILAPFTYLGLLFLIAWYADRLALQGRTLVDNPYVYTLSIAVYCTAWTFYGSVGRAAEAGVEFLTIYLGPTLMAGLWWLVLRKIIRISKQHRITSIADFIASRYGKSMGLGGWRRLSRCWP
ncbi:hypothetical protein [Alkalilimnicola ehrlichii]|uniref:hypothetical protein n=1 Tax=Alkalilimnicola ehrlichii TaxID=351052 RepID=UPI002161E810|nr:hypothetical protein [Alkalilimnicola ehrlichii]